MAYSNNSFEVYIAPAPIREKTPGKSVFLAGSIDEDRLVVGQWRSRITDYLSDLTCTIFNPRRLSWDPSWEQRASNPQFREQVEWELNLLERADVIAMYFDPETESPTMLCELGLYATAKDRENELRRKLVVCCPEGYCHLGNVEIVCERAGIPVIDRFEDLVEEVRRRLRETTEVPKITRQQRKSDVTRVREQRGMSELPEETEQPEETGQQGRHGLQEETASDENPDSQLGHDQTMEQ